MLPRTPNTKPSSTLADRLAVAQRRNFVGRKSELELFQSALLDTEATVSVFYIYGPGGIGKTTLLDEYIQIASANVIPSFRIDGRNMEPTPSGFTIALNQELGIEQGASALEAIAGLAPCLLVVDTAELLQPIETWLRNWFLPRIPESVTVVIASRTPPASEWRTDPGWSELTHIVSLRNLRPDECQRYFEIRNIAESHQQVVLEFTHGHPLALSLVADVLAQGDDLSQFDPRNDPNLVKLLLDRFTRQVPGVEHRAALEICAHMRATTEALLADTLETKDPHGLFQWLRGLSFIEQGKDGLFPHDLARDVLDADLRWRNPERYMEMHHKVRKHIIRRLHELEGIDQQRAFFDLLYLHHNSAIMRPFYDWDSLGKVFSERTTAEDFPAIVEMVRRHEGDTSARIAEYWLEQQPQAFSSFRSISGELLGFSASLILKEMREQDARVDPAIAAAWQFTQRQAPIRPDEVMLHHRFGMDRDAYQLPSPAMNMISMRCLLDWISTPGLAWNILPVAEPEVWHPELSYLYQQRVPEADFTVGGRSYGVFAHDWRALPAGPWLDLMEQRELATELKPTQLVSVPAEPLVVLSQPEFEDAVRRALRDLNKPEALAGNPLLRSRLFTNERGEPADTSVLRAALTDAAEQLKCNPKDERLYRALDATYFRPAATQEAAAERLGLPFSTYRYHLTTGIERITAQLWHRELYGPEE